MQPSPLDQFSNDIRAALIANIPLTCGDGRRLTERELDRLVGLQAQQEHGKSSVDTPTTETRQNELPDWFRAGLSVFHKTGTMVPVLEGLSIRARATHQAIRAVRWTILYLLVVTGFALAGVLFFSNFVRCFSESKSTAQPLSFHLSPATFES